MDGFSGIAEKGGLCPWKNGKCAGRGARFANAVIQEQDSEKLTYLTQQLYRPEPKMGIRTTYYKRPQRYNGSHDQHGVFSV